MYARATTIAVIAALTAASAANAAPWTTEGMLARAPSDASGVSVGIFLHPSEQCATYNLVVAGRTDITQIGLVVDGASLGHSEATRIGGLNVVGVSVSGVGIQAIKAGDSAVVITDQGSVTIGLQGSTRAIASAHAACMDALAAKLADYLKPLEPEAAPEPTASTADPATL